MAAPELFVEEAGPAGAPVVLLVHGSMDRARTFAKVVRLLDRDLRVVRYDRRGYGRSLAGDSSFGMDAQVADAVAVLRSRRCVAVGHSYGGDVVLALAERVPSLVRAAGVWEPPMAWQGWWPASTAGGDAVAAGDPAAAAERFMRRMIGDDRWEALPAATKAARRGEGVALVGELADLRSRPPYRFEAITVPLLAGCGTASRPHHREAARRVAVASGRPLVELDGADHGAHLSRPDEFAAFVRAAVALAPQ
jgi:pimeloyl-ACP methyl ester carboxylesterase